MLPRWLFNLLKYSKNACLLFPTNVYWFWFDVCQCSSIRNKRSNLASLLVQGHVLEKGITMPNRRYGFGYKHVRSLIKACLFAISNYSNEHIEIQSAISDLEQYLLIHKQAGFKLPDDIINGVKALLLYKKFDTQPCCEMARDEYFSNTSDFFEFAHKRHSVRWYSEEKIDDNVLQKAIELAQTAPSACNRQSTKVYIIENKEKKQYVLQLQNGNRGFGHLADKILLITSDMKCWNFGHRVFAYLDAGIYIQNLLYSLHYYHIAACTLNTNLSIKKQLYLRKLIGYSKSEIPIVFVSIGNAPSRFFIAGSQRVDYKQRMEII